MSEEGKKEEGVVNKKLSRRQFIGTAAAGAAVLGTGAILGPKLRNAAVLGSNASPGATQPQSLQPASSNIPSSWDLSADVVVIGSGAAGMPAAIAAADAGVTVIVVEANYDVGGWSIISGGNVPLGGGTSAQTKYGIVDSPDLLFSDLTDWSIVEVNGAPDYRYNDPAIMRAAANNSAPCFEFLKANGAEFVDEAPDNSGAHETGNSAPRENHCVYTGAASLYAPNAAGGTTFIRPLEASARAKGVRFLLNYHMDSLYREVAGPASFTKSQWSGPVLGVMASYTGGRYMPGSATPLQSYASQGNINMTQQTVNIQANKGVIITTGGHQSNVDFRRMFDPRLTADVVTGGEPWAFHDASGEIAAMQVGAALWGLANQTIEISGPFRTGGVIGAKYTYGKWNNTSPIFPICGGEGLSVSNWQDAIVVNQVGNRIWNEMAMGDYPNGNSGGLVSDYVPYSYLNTQYITSSQPVTPSPYNTLPYNFVDAARALNEGSVAPDFSAGPIWAIFDSAAVTREGWTVTPPYVDTANGYFFSAATLTALATQINENPYQAYPMSGATLAATVARYNSFVTSGTDTDFGKPTPKYPIATAPFYAAWFSVNTHDTHSGVRINANTQVVDLWGQPIGNLYCAGESAGGYNQHGNGRCACLGYIAGNIASGVQLDLT